MQSKLFTVCKLSKLDTFCVFALKSLGSLKQFESRSSQAQVKFQVFTLMAAD